MIFACASLTEGRTARGSRRVPSRMLRSSAAGEAPW